MGGKGSGRKPRPIQPRPDKTCENCGKSIAPGRHGRRRFCNNACKQAAYRQRKEEHSRVIA